MELRLELDSNSGGSWAMAIDFTCGYGASSTSASAYSFTVDNIGAAVLPGLGGEVLDPGWYTISQSVRPYSNNRLHASLWVEKKGSGGVLCGWSSVQSVAALVLPPPGGGAALSSFVSITAPTVAVDETGVSLLGLDDSLSIEVADCQNDFDSDPTNGYQVAAELWMRDVMTPTQAYTATVMFDGGVVDFEPGLSAYDPASPFQTPLTPTIGLNMDGNIHLMAAVDPATPSQPGVIGSERLVTLVFTVVSPCELIVPVIEFAPPSGFTAENTMSAMGGPITTNLRVTEMGTFDDTPPEIFGVSADIRTTASVGGAAGTGPAPCDGAYVYFSMPTATDDCDPAPTVTASPPSGSFFSTGSHTVTITATDQCMNSSMETFTVEVDSLNTLRFTVDLPGSLPTSRCLVIATPDACGGETGAIAVFDDHDGNASTPVRATVEVEIGCQLLNEFYIKDPEHTVWACVNVGFEGRGTPGPVDNFDYVGTFEIGTMDVPALLGGDTDNDADVDIHDITWFITQFGSTANAQGCASGFSLRDADFRNDGAVGGDDYTFLTSNYLLFKDRCCTLSDGPGLPLTAPGQHDRARAIDGHLKSVDFNGDEWVDVDDVELFERRHKLSGALSRAMRRKD